MFLNIYYFVERPCVPCRNKNEPELCVDGYRKSTKYLLEDTKTHSFSSDSPDVFSGVLIMKSEFSDLQALVDIPTFVNRHNSPSYSEKMDPSLAFFDWRIAKQDLDPSLSSIYKSSDVTPFCYNSSNNSLLIWASKVFNKDKLIELYLTLGPYRTAILETIRNLSIDDLIHSEKSLLRQVSESSLILGMTGTPCAFWRRSGELLTANKEFSNVLNISHDSFRLQYGKLCIYELMTPSSALSYWKSFTLMANDFSCPPSITIKVDLCPSILTTTDSHSQMLNMMLCITLKRDLFDLPQLVIGHFLPIFN